MTIIFQFVSFVFTFFVFCVYFFFTILFFSSFYFIFAIFLCLPFFCLFVYVQFVLYIPSIAIFYFRYLCWKIFKGSIYVKYMVVVFVSLSYIHLFVVSSIMVLFLYSIFKKKLFFFVNVFLLIDDDDYYSTIYTEFFFCILTANEMLCFLIFTLVGTIWNIITYDFSYILCWILLLKNCCFEWFHSR